MPRARPQLGARLRRVLAMVPWLLVQKESTVQAVAERFGMSEDEVVRELNLVMCCGVPPYGGGDLITIFLDEDGSISAWPGPYLARPMQLTASEGFAVLAAGRALLAVPGAEADGALAGAMAKLERALGDEGGVAIELDAPAFLDAVRSAQAAARRLRITYYSSWRDELTERTIEPRTVYAADGHWYVDGLDDRTGEERRFRVDRIQAAAETGETFEPPDDVRPPEQLYSPAEAELVTINIPNSAAWVTEAYDCEVTELRGRLRVTLPVSGERFLERLLLRIGPKARVERPASMRRVGADAAERILERYRA